MKVRAISRKQSDYTPQRTGDVQAAPRNLTVAPFERAREYTRALNAAKMEKIFAKPFIGALSGHRDGVYALSKVPWSLSGLASASGCGEVIFWDVPTKSIRWEARNAHNGFVRGVVASPYIDGFSGIWSAGDDRMLKLWDIGTYASGTTPSPIATLVSDFPIVAVDHHEKESILVSAGEDVQLWDTSSQGLSRGEPLLRQSWGADTLLSVKMNRVETHLMGATASDRSVVLYDIRSRTPIRKVVMSMNCNDLAWNPQEPFNFTVANEDHSLYTFDMRNLDRARNVHRDHVSAVMSVDYAPTGKEFVSGGYDRSVRLFNADEGHSREIYHTKRMQRVFQVLYSGDAKYVYSGSDDTNIRVWKANASEKLGAVLPRERRAMNYRAKLKERFAHVSEVSRIVRHRHVPKAIHSMGKLKHAMKEAKTVRETNRRHHTRADKVKKVDARAHSIITEEE